MPARRKPTSTRQKKADTQLRRAIKRGDVPAPEPTKHRPKPKASRRGPTGNVIGSAADPATSTSIQAARRLQSAFITLSPEFLEEAKLLASKLPLERPIPIEAAVYCDNTPVSNGTELSCPRRPKWRFDMTKKEVERNEEGLFKKWLEQTDEAVEAWQYPKETLLEEHRTPKAGEVAYLEEPRTMPRSPTHFERNLEVWRQLWRVTEISQILLVLLDSRCPLLHFPPSLRRYLSDRKVILVLTKADVTGPTRVAAWVEYFHEYYPAFPIVQVESYAEKEAGAEHQGENRFEPHLPHNFREQLVEAIRNVHSEMLQPPDKVRSNTARLYNRVPPVKRRINWAGLLQTGDPSVEGFASVSEVGEESARMRNVDREANEPEFLTVGLIGQPNVGKSSLLNALFGMSRVRASKTPGKTKHFQTLFWTSDVRLVDCPGLVMPNFIPMELQVLCGILPIARVSAVPSCIYYVSQLLPIEEIYNLNHPSLSSPPVEDKRTWRSGVKPSTMNKPLMWTAMDILTAYAKLKGWVTAKAGRPDIHRAGNSILKALAEGKIGWAFWPPGRSAEEITMTTEWEFQGAFIDSESESESEEEDGVEDESSIEVGLAYNESGAGGTSDGEGVEDKVLFISGRFGALSVIDDEPDDAE